jgi:hypothetical protein
MQRIDDLHIRKSIEKDDALDDLVSVLHFLEGFGAPFLRQRAISPILQEPVVQPVLIDGGELVPQASIEILDYPGVALHDAGP